MFGRHTLQRLRNAAERKIREKLSARSRNPGIDINELADNINQALYRRAAKDLGCTVTLLRRLMCISGNGKTYRVFRTWTDVNFPPTKVISGDKVLTRQFLSGHNLSIPAGESFRHDQAKRALDFALSLQRPCVVKPALDTWAGKGVSLNLSSPRQIRKAFHLASLYCNEILIEEFVPGENYRFLVLNGKCLSAVHREPASVVGNGKDTVRELVRKENAGRIHRSDWSIGDPEYWPIPLNRLARVTLKKQGLNLSSVVPKGQLVRLNNLCQVVHGATFYEVLDDAHPATVRAAELAASVIGLQLAGVDVISPDIRAPAYWINEVNSIPVLFLHYFVRNKSACKDPIRAILSSALELPAS